eukprot:5968807-Amphidinium_carterae.1
MPCEVGIDAEWGGRCEWLHSSMALLQIAIPSQVFLVDIATGNKVVCSFRRDAPAPVEVPMFTCIVQVLGALD